MFRITTPPPYSPSNPKPNPPANPIHENNQRSEESIKDISQTTSVEEARRKAQQEINDLLDRYGVKSSQLNSALWTPQANWETYLTTLTTPEQITSLVKKMKVAIIQQNHNNQTNQKKLSLSQLQNKVIQEVNDLLKKYSSVKKENLLKGEKNWEQKIRSLTSSQQILSLARRLREIIVHQNNQQRKQKSSPTDNSSTNFPAHLVIPISLGVVGILIGAILLIRHRKIRLRKKRKK